MRHVPRLTERARALLTELNLHYAGVALLLVLVLYLGLHLLFVWQTLGSLNADAMDRQRVDKVKVSRAPPVADKVSATVE